MTAVLVVFRVCPAVLFLDVFVAAGGGLPLLLDDDDEEDDDEDEGCEGGV